MKTSGRAVRRRSVLAGMTGALVAPAIVSAQGIYPNRPIRYINPYPAGGPTDTLSRLFCAKMTELSGQQWIVENRGGAGGNSAPIKRHKSLGRLDRGRGRAPARSAR